MTPREHDMQSVLHRAHEAAESLDNAVDAGMFDSSKDALNRLQVAISEAEALASTNGKPALAAVPLPNGVPAADQSQNLESEEAILGACMITAAAIKAASAEITADDFSRNSHRVIYLAIMAIADSEDSVDAITVSARLEQQGALSQVTAGSPGGPEGKGRVFELANLVPTSANVAHYARIVRRCSLERKLSAAVTTSPRDTDAIAEAAAALTRERVAGGPRRALDGAEWLAAQPEGCPAVWGKQDRVLWAEGEPLMIYGPDGVGKTSVAQQIVLALCGIRTEPLFDLPFVRADRPVLYLACDRPRQARRSLYRMIPREKHGLLEGKLLVWEGPLPFSIPAQPRALLEFVQLHEAGYVIIDSLKDVAVALTDPEIALKVNQAFQWLAANSIENLVLHHPRKDPAGVPARAKTLEDVYGDRNFVAGMGSVIALYGKAGDPVVQLEHLKQPSGEVGPFKILHNHDTGTSTLYEHRTFVEILVDARRPLRVDEVASIFYGSPDPSKSELEKARRELRKMVEQKEAQEMKDTESGAIAFASL